MKHNNIVYIASAATVLILAAAAVVAGVKTEVVLPDVVAPGAEPVRVAEGFSFSEGPAADSEGNVYFSDYGKNRIHKLTPDGTLSVFRENVGGSIGLYFDSSDNLYACTARNHRITRFAPDGAETVFADRFGGKLFNSPNDIWIDPKGGVYFTDPRFSPLPEEVEQDGMHVYYIPPGGGDIIRAADDLDGPNGIVGTPDGNCVYVTDTRADVTYVYSVAPDGRLFDKRTFAQGGYDGMTLDIMGNVYITTKHSIEVYNSGGAHLTSIAIPDMPGNVCFGGPDRMALYVTARVSVYTLAMRVRGI